MFCRIAGALHQQTRKAYSATEMRRHPRAADEMLYGFSPLSPAAGVQAGRLRGRAFSPRRPVAGNSRASY